MPAPPERRLRVLLLIDHINEAGGAERFTLGLALGLPRDRFESWVCSTRGEYDTHGPLDAAGIPHISLGRRGRWDLHRFLRLVRLLRQERFDVLHAHMFGSNLWGTLLGRACRVPVVVAHEHNWSYTGEPLRVWLDGRVIGRLAHRFIAVSKANRDLMVGLEHVPASKVVVIPTAYIPSEEATAGDIRSELGIGPDTPLIGVAAVLRDEKALDVLLDAHHRVLARVPDAHLVIAGEGDCRAELEAQARRLQIEDRVHFLGMRADVDSILRGIDVGALSSHWEGMPLFIFECMAAHAALAATAVGGVPEVVEHEKTGLLVRPDDPEALAEALIRLLLDRELRERIASAATDRLGEFTIESVSARVGALYEQLLAEARARRRLPWAR